MIRFAMAAIALATFATAAQAQPRPISPDRIAPRETRPEGGPPLQPTERLERISLATAAAREALSALPHQSIDESLFALARERIGGRLESLRRAGVLVGSRPDQAWYARCNDATTPRAMRRLGRLRCEVGAAVQRPGEFHIILVERGGLPRK